MNNQRPIPELQRGFPRTLPCLKNILDHFSWRLTCSIFQFSQFICAETPTKSTQIFLCLFDSLYTRYGDGALTNAPVYSNLITIYSWLMVFCRLTAISLKQISKGSSPGRICLNSRPLGPFGKFEAVYFPVSMPSPRGLYAINWTPKELHTFIISICSSP